MIISVENSGLYLGQNCPKHPWFRNISFFPIIEGLQDLNTQVIDVGITEKIGHVSDLGPSSLCDAGHNGSSFICHAAWDISFVWRRAYSSGTLMVAIGKTS